MADALTTQPFPNRFFGLGDDSAARRLGVVIGGSLNEGVLVKLDGSTIVEGLAVGSYVTITGQTNRKFFGLITDIVLDAADSGLAKLPAPDDDLRLSIYRGTITYGVLHVKPMLVQDERGEVKPVKSVPTHFSIACSATPEEVQEIFQAEEGKAYRIGASLEDANIEIKLNLERLVERSSAVFGRSGTGKTFLTLPLLASVIKPQKAINIVAIGKVATCSMRPSFSLIGLS